MKLLSDSNRFKYHLQPSIDFMQEIFSHGSQVEIHAPQYLREHAQEELSKSLDRYKEDKKAPNN